MRELTMPPRTKKPLPQVPAAAAPENTFVGGVAATTVATEMRKSDKSSATAQARKRTETSSETDDPEIPDNPSQEIDADALRVEKRLSEIRQEYGEAQETRLRINYKIWWSRRDGEGRPAVLRKDHEEELRRFGILPIKTTEVGDPTAKYPLEVSQRDMAKIISEQFKTTVLHDTLSKMRKAKVAWVALCVGSGNRWKPNITLRLWEENMGDKQIYESEANLKLENLRLDNQKKRDERDQFHKQHDGKWGLISSMKSFALGLAALVAGSFDKFIEDKDGARRIVREAYLKCGATEEMVLRTDALLATEFQIANDGLKKQCGIEGERAMKWFEQQRRDEIKEKNL